ncbi:hypothetical protein N7492_010197 [Penicillium capsulatum]|uniref:Chromo domain-containing protein n=1 Tax=Penicillium capsulatum TaxID=69766 RepID=A0A9W9HNW8_9EURO|nr:hypothetical protein N7492_010197 [Penicillium capsulatum]KAJ6112705.1 hypothetical protein N7512_008029 [Penicillium capsulatum]
MACFKTWKDVRRYLPVLYYLVVAAVVILGRLAARHYTNPNISLDTHTNSKFPIDTKGGSIPDGDWQMQYNFTVIDTFSGEKAEQPDKKKKSSFWPQITDKLPTTVHSRGQIHVQVTAVCPKDAISRQLCLMIAPEVEAAFGLGLENIEQFLYTADTADDVPIEANLKRLFVPSIPKVEHIEVNIRHFSPEEKDSIGYVTRDSSHETEAWMNLDLDYILDHPLSALEFQVHSLVQHEMVHCYQHFKPDEKNERPPQGLIEGIADFVVLKAGLLDVSRKGPRPFAAQMRPPQWDVGYAQTAYFLEWLEDVRIGKGAIGKLNDGLLRVGYHLEGLGKHDETGREFWTRMFGATADELWEEYGAWLDSRYSGWQWAMMWINFWFRFAYYEFHAASAYLASEWGTVFVFLHVLIWVGIPVLVYHIAVPNLDSSEPAVDEDQSSSEEDDSSPPQPVPSQFWSRLISPVLQSFGSRPKLTVHDEEGMEWEVEAIVESRTFYKKLQYRVRWVGEINTDPKWYYAETFKHGPGMLKEYHDKNPEAPGPSVRMPQWFEAVRTSETPEDHPHDNKPVSKHEEVDPDEGKASKKPRRTRPSRG